MATLYWRNGVAYLNWRENGKRKRKSLGKISRHEAATLLHAKEYELRTGQRILPTGLIFSNFVTEYLSWYSNEYPDSVYRVAQIIDQHLSPVFGFSPLENISRREVEQYRHDRINAGARRSTVNKEVNVLKAVINRAVMWDYISANPIQALPKLQELDSKPPHFYTMEELETLYRWSPNHWHWWRFMANTGVRRKEALQIENKRDIGADALRIISTAEARTKSARWREVPLSDNARLALERFDRSGRYLFPRIHPASLSRAFVKCASRASLGGSVHALRHSFCSHLVMNGVPLRVVQALAGHANYKTTERYAHLSPDHLSGSFNLSL